MNTKEKKKENKTKKPATKTNLKNPQKTPNPTTPEKKIQQQKNPNQKNNQKQKPDISYFSCYTLVLCFSGIYVEYVSIIFIHLARRATPHILLYERQSFSKSYPK